MESRLIISGWSATIQRLKALVLTLFPGFDNSMKFLALDWHIEMCTIQLREHSSKIFQSVLSAVTRDVVFAGRPRAGRQSTFERHYLDHRAANTFFQPNHRQQGNNAITLCCFNR